MQIALALALPTPLSAPSASAQQHTPEPGYQDDRSTPEAVIGSFYDAINGREYARAYSYWESGSAETQLRAFDDFAQGYAETQQVDLTTGEVGSGVAAGQLYYSVPVTLVARMTDGTMQTFVGCYTLHLARPQLQAQPPFRPLALQRASIQEVDNDADTAGLMASTCPPV